MINFSKTHGSKLLKSFLYASLLGAHWSYAQQEILLKSGTYTPSAKSVKNAKARNNRSRVGASDYVLIQFYKTPTINERASLLASGVELLEYVPHNAYWASLKAGFDDVLLQEDNVRSVSSIENKFKIDPTLGLTNDATLKTVVVSYFKTASPEGLLTQLQQLGGNIVRHHAAVHKVEIKIAASALTSIAEIPEVSYISPSAPASVSGDLKGSTSHRAHVLQAPFTGSFNLNGDGVTIGVGDAGYVGPHADLQNRVFNIKPSVLQGWAVYGHEVHVSGIVAGAGNIQPDNKGMAPKANIVTDQAEAIIYDAPSHVANYGISLTNNSYWWFSATPGVYNYLSSLVDEQLLQYPQLQHVIISGNPGSDYGKVEGYFASAKNTLTVGSVDAYDNISSFSGRGPCVDGRLKPEIVAFGDGVTSTLPDNSYGTYLGTSMACPGVTGTLALLSQQYNNIHGTLPNAGLIKAIACNTAQDLGNPGPDYAYGFGRINARRAAQSLSQAQYWANTVGAGSTATHTLAVPAGTRQLRVLLYWKDPAASDAAATALVNNLDLTVNNGITLYRPWILNPSSPSQNATRGIDNRNNIEQITIDAPTAGTYTFQVNGAGITSGTSQEYFITYELVQAGLQVIYPVGGESLTPQTSALIRWDASGTASSVNLEYTTNDGTTWNSIAAAVPASQGWYEWVVPEVVSGTVKVRLSDGNLSGQSLANASIMPSPSGLSALQSNDSIRLSWTALAEASNYEVYLLKSDAKTLELIGSTSKTSYALPYTEAGSPWVSIRAKASNGALSKRAEAIQPLRNAQPTVVLTSPAPNAVYKLPASVNLEAQAADADGSIQKVEFYDGPTKLGEDLVAPYTYTWTAPTVGSHTLSATAYDNVGNTASSTKVPITIEAANTAPSVVILNPKDSANFTAPAQFTITASATDNDGTVTKVEFYNGTSKLGEDLSSPYNFTWANVPVGTYRITVKATDNTGESKVSEAITIKVNATQSAPVVAISSPATNASYTAPATIAISANASDVDGNIAKVEFYSDGVKLGEDLSTPYTLSWSNVTAGTYVLTAKATDLTGLSTTSSSVSVKVSNNIAPTVSISQPADKATFTAPASISIQATASDVDGTVSKVEFYNGTSKLGEDLSSPYTFTWSNVPANTYTLNVKAIDNLGATSTTSISISVSNPPTANLIGPDCGVNNNLLAFEVNPSKRSNATNYSWWFTGSAQSLTPVQGSPYLANLQTGTQFNPGQVCVGINYNISPWYVSYCKNVSRCAARLENVDETQEVAVWVSPNPSAESFMLHATLNIKEYTVWNSLGQIVDSQNQSALSNSFGVSYPTGMYVVKVYFEDGSHQTLRIDKIN